MGPHSKRTENFAEVERAGAVAQFVVHGGYCLTSGIPVARAVNRSHRKRKRESAEADRLHLDMFQKGEGRELVDRLVSEYPTLSRFRLTDIPSVFGACIKVEGAKPERIVDALSWAAAYYRESDLGTALSSKRSEIHATFPDRGKHLAFESAAEVDTKCCKLGLCLYARSDAGKNLVQKPRHYVRVLKQVFPPHAAQRQLLIDARVVVRVAGEPLRKER